MKAILVVLLAVLVLAPFPGIHAESEQAQPMQLTITNAPKGFVFPDDHTQECNGQLALVATDYPGCEFEEDVRGGLGYLAVGFRSVNAGNTGPIPLTGLLTAHLSSDAGDMRWTCSWRNGAWSGCSIEPPIAWPEYGASFTFDCYSEFWPTAGADGASRGHWGECYLAHA